MSAPDTNESPAPRGGEGWNCGNGALSSRLTLLLVEGARIRVDRETIEMIDGLAQDAGPVFCTAMIERIMRDEMPF